MSTQSWRDLMHELGDAIRAVNTACDALPGPHRPDPTDHPDFDAINTAVTNGDQEAAMAAIRAWPRYWLRLDSGGARPDPRTAVR